MRKSVKFDLPTKTNDSKTEIVEYSQEEIDYDTLMENETFRCTNSRPDWRHHLNMFQNKELRAFTRIFGNYRIKDFEYNPTSDNIGSGKFGKIYRALWKSMNKTVAIKVQEKEIFYKAKLWEQVKRELTVQYSLSYMPFICSLYTAFYDEKYMYYILEYAAKNSLYKEINRKRRDLIEAQQTGSKNLHSTIFEESGVQLIIFQYANIIKFLHFNGVMHRDLKPENILLFENNLIKVNDFGWCFIDPDMALDSNTHRNRKTFCGTDDYLVPDVIKGEYTDYVDVWTIGVLCYELLYGCTPFNTNNVNDSKFVRERIVNNKRIDISTKKGISHNCKHFIEYVLVHDQQNRPTIHQILLHDFISYDVNYETYGNIGKFWNMFWKKYPDSVKRKANKLLQSKNNF